MRRIAGMAMAMLALGWGHSAAAMFVNVPPLLLQEVPVKRLVANIQNRRSKMPEAEKARAIGRLHMLAYIRQANHLQAARIEVQENDRTVHDEFALPSAGVMPCPAVGDSWEYRHGVCAREYWSFGPLPELPPGALKTSPPPNAELTASIDAYLKARDLEPSNLRTRVGLAFVLSRAGRQDEALAELRYAVGAGLERIPQLPAKASDRDLRLASPDWEGEIVLHELVGEMKVIATDPQDVALADELSHRLSQFQPTAAVTPIIVSLSGSEDFDDMIDRASPVAFDYTGQGPLLRDGWPKPSAAWLVWDPKRRGHIDSGFQLFGSVTWVAFWDNGYRPLAALDDNGDGRLTGRELDGLAIWRDLNGDGVSEPGEVVPVRSAGIVALSLSYQQASPGLWTSPAGATFKDGRTRPTYDWTVRAGAIARDEP